MTLCTVETLSSVDVAAGAVPAPVSDVSLLATRHADANPATVGFPIRLSRAIALTATEFVL